MTITDRSFLGQIAPIIEAAVQRLEGSGDARWHFEIALQQHPNGQVQPIGQLFIFMASPVLGDGDLIHTSAGAVNSFTQSEIVDQMVLTAISQLREAKAAKLQLPGRQP